MKTFDAADAVRKLVTTPDDLGPCQQYCEVLKAEVRRLRGAEAVLKTAVAYGIWPDLNSEYGFLKVVSAAYRAWVTSEATPKEQR